MWYGLERHASRKDQYIRWYVLGIAVAAATMAVLQVLHVLLRQRFFYRGLPRAQVRQLGYATCIDLFSPTKVVFEAGQYLNLYMPGVSFRSCVESHPFIVVASQQQAQGTSLELMIEPRRGWTNRLLRCDSASEKTVGKSYVAFFSGPHGRTVPVNEFGTVVMIASGWGIMAQIPFLQYLIRSFNDSSTKARRIHMIWQLDHISMPPSHSLGRDIRLTV